MVTTNASYSANITAVLESATWLADRVTELETQLSSREVCRGRFHDYLDTGWVIVSSILMCMCRAGLGLVEAGVVRQEHVVEAYTKQILDLTLGIIPAAFWGFNFAYPDVGIHVTSLTGLGNHGGAKVSFFLYCVFQSNCVAIVSGALAERTRLAGYSAFVMFIAALMYPVSVRLTWGGGFLSKLEPPFRDFGGSGVVHMMAGFASLVGCIVVGPRLGRWDENKGSDFVPRNVSTLLCGVLVVVVGWYGFNVGGSTGVSTRADMRTSVNAIIATTYSGVCGGAVNFLISVVRNRLRRFDIIRAGHGTVAGLVAITACSDIVHPSCAMAIGAIAGLLFRAVYKIRMRLGIDDVVDAFAVHGACGLWGLLAVGILHPSTGLFYSGDFDQLASQLVGSGVLVIIGVAPPLLLLIPMKMLGVLRVRLADEEVGTDARMRFTDLSRRTRLFKEHQWTAGILATFGFKPLQAIAALEFVRNIIYRPFTPQAAENKLKGELEDILEHLDYPPGEQKGKYLTFIAHHREDCAEVARIMCDRIRLALKVTGDADRFEATKHFSMKQLAILGTENLNDLAALLDCITSSRNFMLLLTRQIFTRPWVLAELITAHTHEVNLVCVLVEWTMKDDARQLRFTVDLNKAINDWKEYLQMVAEGQVSESKVWSDESAGNYTASIPEVETWSMSSAPEQPELDLTPGPTENAPEISGTRTRLDLDSDEIAADSGEDVSSVDTAMCGSRACCSRSCKRGVIDGIQSSGHPLQLLSSSARNLGL